MIPTTSLNLLSALTFNAIVFVFLNFSFPVYASSGIPGNDTDQLALMMFKSGITEDPQGVLDSWNASVSFCLWPGVACGLKHRRVTVLDLGGHGLGGTLSSQIGNLSFLRILDLSDNSLHGEIPSELGHLIRLQTMNLSYNYLGGEIPANLSRCVGLVDLILDHNHFEGHIPVELGSLMKLEALYLKNNNLTGSIPASIGNLTSLTELYISYNDLEGEVPETMAKMRSLTMLGMSVNSLSGEFPPALYNLSSLQLIGLSFNKFRGTLRADIGIAFPNLQFLYLATNYFIGVIPASLSNATGLLRLDIPYNNFTGNVPMSFGSLQNLLWLNVLSNQLGRGAPDDMDFVTSLCNCRKLEFLDFADNRFGGMFPNSITNLSTTLTKLLIGGNKIQGMIPREISNLVNLNELSIEETMITGNIPDSIGMLSNLESIHFESNKLTGNIPSSLGKIRGLLRLYLQDNSLEGSIPSSLGNCVSLQNLDISQNKLTGTIPKQVLSLSSLSVLLNMSYNSLIGPLPIEVGNLSNLAAFDVSNNRLSGELPSTLGGCVSLEILNMQHNLFVGPLPPLNNLKNIQYLDVSQNNFSGHIPPSMAKNSTLLYLNLSFNNLEGEVPARGVFAYANRIDVTGNINLCGGIKELDLHPCVEEEPQKSRKHTALIIALVLIVVAVCLSIALLLAVFWKKKVKRSRANSSSQVMNFHAKAFANVSYEDLLNATGGFSSQNLIGSGSFGSVYRGTLASDGTIVAVKVLKLQQMGADKSFLAECQALRHIRHRNLVKILTVCSSVDFSGNEFKALVYQYMPNGSLEEWLHQKDREDRRLSIFQRLNIAIDIASALQYLHDQSQPPVIHCDLKPSNILLDDDLCAHVSDFGLARLLSNPAQEAEGIEFSSLGIKGTIGYAAPGNTLPLKFATLHIFSGVKRNA